MCKIPAQGLDKGLRRLLLASKGRPMCASCTVARLRATVSPLEITMTQRRAQLPVESLRTHRQSKVQRLSNWMDEQLPKQTSSTAPQ